MVEFYSPVYLAAIVLKHGANSSEEQIKKYGVLEKLQKSFDFNLLPSQSMSAKQPDACE